MPKRNDFQIGLVFVKQLADGRWRASWTCPQTKRHVRRVLPVTAFRDAKAQAEAINLQVATGRGFHGQIRGASGLAVRDAILEAIRNSGAREGTRREYVNRGNGFLGFLESQMPGIEAWSEITPGICQAYLAHLRKSGLAFDTIRQRVYVLRLTSRYMSETHEGYRNVASTLRLKKSGLTKSETTARDSVLSPRQTRDLLSRLSEANPMVHVWATLQARAGLRELEAAYLRECDIDFAAGTITIAASAAHTPKNAHSHRTIPVSPVILATLRTWIQSMKIRHSEGYLFFPQRETRGRKNLTPAARAGAYSHFGVSRIWADTLKADAFAGLALPESFTPRKLRSVFVTGAREAGADFADLQTYIGHRPLSVLAGHYDAVSMDRLSRIPALVDGWIGGGFEAESESEGGK